MMKDQFTPNTVFCCAGAKYVNPGLCPDGAVYDSHFFLF